MREHPGPSFWGRQLVRRVGEPPASGSSTPRRGANRSFATAGITGCRRTMSRQCVAIAVYARKLELALPEMWVLFVIA